MEAATHASETLYDREIFRRFFHESIMAFLCLMMLAGCKQTDRTIHSTDYSDRMSRPHSAGKATPGFRLTQDNLEGLGFLNLNLPALEAGSGAYYEIRACPANGGACITVKSFEGEISVPTGARGDGKIFSRVCLTGPPASCGNSQVTPYRGIQSTLPEDAEAGLTRLFLINYRLRDLLFEESLYMYHQRALCPAQGEPADPETFFRSLSTEPVDEISKIIAATGGEEQDFSQFSLPVPPDNYLAIILPDQTIIRDAAELIPKSFSLTDNGNEESKEEKEKSKEEKEKSKEEKLEQEIDKAIDATKVLGSIGIAFAFNFVYASTLLNRMSHWKAWTEGQKTITWDKPPLKGTNLTPGKTLELKKVLGRKNMFAVDVGNGKFAYYLRDINKKIIRPPIAVQRKVPDIQMRGTGLIEELDSSGKVVNSFLPDRVELSNKMLGDVQLSRQSLSSGVLEFNKPLPTKSGITDPTEYRMRTMIERHKYDPRVDSDLGARYGGKYRKGYVITTATLASLNAALLVYALSNFLSDSDPDKKFFELTMAISVLNMAYNIVDVWDAMKTRTQWMAIRNQTPDLSMTRKAMESSPVSLRRQVETTKYASPDDYARAGVMDDLKYKAGEISNSFSGAGKGRIIMSTAFIITSLAGIIHSANELEKMNLTGEASDPDCRPQDLNQFLAHMINIRNIRLALITNTGQIMQALGDW